MQKTILVIFLLSVSYFLRAQDYRFRQITDKEGLKYTWVWDIYKDSEGFIWFSTQEGAFRFDGFNFVQFDYSMTNSVPGKRIFFVFEDSEKYIWFGTETGLDRYDRKTNLYKSYNHDSQQDNSISAGN